jgi:hypothetical protein
MSGAIRRVGATLAEAGNWIFTARPPNAVVVQESVMTKEAHRLCGMAVIGAVLFCLPALSTARADQPVEQTHAAKLHPKTRPGTNTGRSQSGFHRNLYGAAPVSSVPGCTWPYQNQFPPCMSTWPAGDSHYHGSRPGPTFGDD